MTVSMTMSVTRPTKRLRADRPTPEGSSGRTAFSRASRARARPSTTVRDDASRSLSSVPSAIQRRTVSSLTPRNTAASRIRI